jgi:hypothetical protein
MKKLFDDVALPLALVVLLLTLGLHASLSHAGPTPPPPGYSFAPGTVLGPSVAPRCNQLNGGIALYEGGSGFLTELNGTTCQTSTIAAGQNVSSGCALATDAGSGGQKAVITLNPTLGPNFSNCACSAKTGSAAGGAPVVTSDGGEVTVIATDFAFDTWCCVCAGG